MFAGARNIPGGVIADATAAILTGFSASGFSFAAPEFSETLGLAETAFTSNFRGDVSPFRQMSGTATAGFSNATANYTVSTGPTFGHVSFDTDASVNFHYDHTSPVPSGALDFYSTAMHELVHTIGLGTTHAWTSMTNGTSWLGTQGQLLQAVGTTNSLVDPSGHIAGGISSPNIDTGVNQTPLMGAFINRGERRGISEIDRAFL